MKGTETDPLNHRQLSIWDYLPRDTAEREEHVGVWSSGRINETDSIQGAGTMEGLLEVIFAPENFHDAVQQVKRNKGAGGIDKMQVEAIDAWLVEHRETLLQSLRDGTYRPQAVRRVEIPKDNGKMRQLGIPTVIDRAIQQAISQKLTPIYETIFSEHSYGFRPQRGAHMALEQCIRYANEGYRWVVDMDLEKFFDTVNQSKLVQLLSLTIQDGRVISLIHKYMRAGVMSNHLFEASETGVPQGGPLSPLLGNIMLNECDQELETRGHRFVRYADDMLIFCKSRKAAERVRQSITKFLERKLFLKVNREKTQVAYIGRIKFLGYGFYQKEGNIRLTIHEESYRKLKMKLKALTSRSNGMSTNGRRQKLNQLVRGWVNYFKLADMKRKLEDLDAWLRRRIRMVTWKRWKKVRTRYKNLKRAGIKENQAWQWANARKGYWRVAGSWILTRAIPNALIEKAGYLSLTACYNQAT